MNRFFVKREKSFMCTVVKKALGLEHYWGRVEFAPGRGAIHLHSIDIARDNAYLQDFYSASTNEEKATVLDKYTWENLDMTADVSVNDNPFHKLDYQHSSWKKVL